MTARAAGASLCGSQFPQQRPAEEQVARRTRFAARSYRALGEQRIDIVLTVGSEADPCAPDLRPVVGAARRHGVGLARA